MTDPDDDLDSLWEMHLTAFVSPEEYDRLLDAVHGPPNPTWAESAQACDPVGDIREFGASVLLDRALTPFERVVVRAGLSNGSEFLDA